MTVVSRATSRRSTRPGSNRTTRHPRAGRGPTRGPTRGGTRPTRRYLPPALLTRTQAAPMRSRTKSSFILWFLMAADLATAIWMYTVGDWLDHTSKLTATATFGGHHYAVLIAAAAAFLTLATLAILTEGFTKTTRPLTVIQTAACILSLTVLTGLTALLLAALLTRLIAGPLRP